MNIAELIFGLCLAFMAAMATQNVVAGLQAQAHGVASHQEGRP